MSNNPVILITNGSASARVMRSWTAARIYKRGLKKFYVATDVDNSGMTIGSYPKALNALAQVKIDAGYARSQVVQSLSKYIEPHKAVAIVDYVFFYGCK